MLVKAAEVRLIEKYSKSRAWSWTFSWNVEINLIRKARFNWKIKTPFFISMLTYFVIASFPSFFFSRKIPSFYRSLYLPLRSRCDQTCILIIREYCNLILQGSRNRNVSGNQEKAEHSHLSIFHWYNKTVSLIFVSWHQITKKQLMITVFLVQY